MNIKQRLPKVLKANDVWRDFCDVVQDELEFLFTDFKDIKNTYSTRAQKDISSLRAIAQEHNEEIDLTLFNDDIEALEYMKREVRNISLKKYIRTTKKYYEYILNRISQSGHLFLVYADNMGVLHKAIDYTSLNTILATHNFSKVLKNTPGEYPTAAQINTISTLDETPVKLLDAGTNEAEQALGFEIVEGTRWSLDSNLLGKDVSITNHIIVEYLADELFEKDSQNYLMVEEFLLYLARAVNWGRKTTNIPHIGVLINLLTLNDESINTDELGNTFAVTSEYASKASLFVDEDVDLTLLYSKVVVSKNNTFSYYKVLVSGEINRTDEFDVINTCIPAFAINEELFGVGDEVTDTFNHTVAYPGVIPKSYRLYFKSHGDDIEIVDNGKGYLESTKMWNGTSWVETIFQVGTINYNTGAIQFIAFDSEVSDVIPTTGNIQSAYKTTQKYIFDTVEIESEDGTIIAEGTILPVEFATEENHLSLQIVIDKRAT